ncbi:MAG: hypothetical protein AAGC67_12665 [Myxococcota bacterium]
MILKRATSLLGLVALFVSCASVDRGGVPVAERFAPPRPLPAWVDAPPTRCAVGSSGPTLNPRNAIRYARVAAIDALAAGSLSVDVQSITGSDGRGDFEMTAQSLSGVLADARIAALFAETNPGREGRARLRQVHALACFPEADLRGLPDPGYPRWLVDVPGEAGRVCATGISGPTRKPEDQAPSALGDARLALAIALESRIEKRVFDDGRGVARMAREIDPSPDALRRAARADALEERWLDARGEGPLGLPGVLYGLVCVE